MSQPRDVAEVPGSATEVRWYGVVLLVGHLALTVIGAVSLWRIAGGWWVGAAAAALIVLGYLALWRYLLAPGSRQRCAGKLHGPHHPPGQRRRTVAGNRSLRHRAQARRAGPAVHGSGRAAQ